MLEKETDFKEGYDNGGRLHWSCPSLGGLQPKEKTHTCERSLQRTVSCGRDATVSQGTTVRSLHPEEEGAETTWNELGLTTTSIPYPVHHRRGGSSRAGSKKKEVEEGVFKIELYY